MHIAGRPHQPGDQKYVDEKLDARLNQKVFPEQMRGAADCVRGLMRASVVEVGHELLKIKATQIEHGQFTDWVRLECKIHIRTAQRYMKAAEFIGEHDKLSYLPADGLLALSSDEAEPIAEQIINRIEAGDRPTAAEIKREIAAAMIGRDNARISKDPLDGLQSAVAKLDSGQLRQFAKWFEQYREEHQGETAAPHRASVARQAVVVDESAWASPIFSDATQRFQPVGTVEAADG